MSGIEIAGLLLGAFPLLISALEHYRQSAEVLDDWWEIKKEYKKCKNEIKLQELTFEGNLERFLLPLIVDDDEIAALIAEPGGVKWKDPALEERLKGRLPKSYDLFLDTIYDIKGTVDGLKDELGINRDGFQKGLTTEVDQKQPGKSGSLLRKLLQRPKQESSAGSADSRWKKWLSRSNIEFQTQRVKFGLGRTNRAKLFEEFTRYNTRLKELLDTNDKSTALKQSRELIKSSAIRKRLCKFWRHASCLHDLLCQAWCCQCKHLHHACLFLRHETNSENYYFSIGFLYAPRMAAEPFPWYWKEVDAQHVNDEASEANLSFVVPPSSIPQSSSPEASSKSSMRGPHPASPPSRPKVNWAHPQSSASSHTVITDLCSTIATCRPTDNTLGLLKGEEDSYLLQRRGHAQSPSRAYETISLEYLLGKTSGLPLTRRQRYQIGFTLAASHLQLYASPWLNSHWSKKDIIFQFDPQDPLSIQIDQPYILRAVSTQTPTSTPSYASGDRCLTTLGILLIELCFGTALEDHEKRRQYHSSVEQQTATPDPAAALDLAAVLDLAVAMEWSQSVGGEAGEAYADAVSWCLRVQIPGAKDDKWREELFANVVRPLQSCWEQFHPMSREEWPKAGPVG